MEDTWATEPIEAVPPAPSPAESSPLSTLAGYPHVLLKAPIKPNFSLLTKIIVHKIIVLRPSEFPPKRSCALTSPWMSRVGLAPAFVLVQRSCAGSHGQCPFPRAGEISSLSLVYDQEQQSKDDLSPPLHILRETPPKAPSSCRWGGDNVAGFWRVQIFAPQIIPGGLPAFTPCHPSPSAVPRWCHPLLAQAQLHQPREHKYSKREELWPGRSCSSGASPGFISALN